MIRFHGRFFLYNETEEVIDQFCKFISKIIDFVCESFDSSINHRFLKSISPNIKILELGDFSMEDLMEISKKTHCLNRLKLKNCDDELLTSFVENNNNLQEIDLKGAYS